MFRNTTPVPWVIAVAIGAAVVLNAQTGGDREIRLGAERAGTVEHVTVHGKALEGNLEGDSPDRDVTVYLPPSYAADQARRFPVVYLLHGYGGRDDTFTTRLAKLPESADRLAAAQGFSEAIVVTPNAFTLHKGSMYSNSATTGDWERSSPRISWPTSTATTARSPAVMSRGLAGHSMGGYGALRIGMKRPGRVLEPVHHERVLPDGEPQSAAGGDGGRRSDQDARAGRGGGAGARLRRVGESRVGGGVVAESREPAALPRSPVKDGKVRPDIVAKWVANAPLEMIEQYAVESAEVLRRSRSRSAPRTRCSPRTGNCTTR